MRHEPYKKNRISLRLSDKEDNDLREHCDEHGCGSLSLFIRTAIKEKIKRDRKRFWKFR